MLALDKGKGIENADGRFAGWIFDRGNSGKWPWRDVQAGEHISGLLIGRKRNRRFCAGAADGSIDLESESQPYQMSAISVPIPGESVCGDAWSAEHESGRSLYIVLMAWGTGRWPRKRR